MKLYIVHDIMDNGYNLNETTKRESTMTDIYHKDTLAAKNNLEEIIGGLDGILCEDAMNKINSLILEVDGLLDEYVSRTEDIEALIEELEDV